MTIDYSKFANIVDSDDDKPTETDEGSGAKPTAAPEKPHCFNCHKDITKPLRCGVCKKAEYCSAKCQKEDWQFHKRNCKKPEEPKPKEKAAPSKPKENNEERKKRKEEKVTEDDEDVPTWYRHREWKPTAEPKKDFTPAKLDAEAAAGSAVEAVKKTDGSAWNAAGTWEEKDVTEKAKKTLQEALVAFSNIDAAGGQLSAEDVASVDGEASKPVIRGKRRHMFDLSFKVNFAFRWMDGSGQRKATGSIEIADFTNDTFQDGVLTAPAVRFSFKDGKSFLDDGRRRALEDAVGAASWPPPKGSLMALASDKMSAWASDYQQSS